MTCRIEVRVQPGARRNEVTNHGDELRVRVVAAAERGKANEAVIGLLADRLGLPKSALRVARGAASRRKVIEVDGLSAEEATRRLEEAG